MKRRKTLGLLSAVLFLTGFLVCIYPWINKSYVNLKQKDTVESYLAYITPDEVSQESIPAASQQIPTEFVPQKHIELWDEMQAYNEKIWNEKQAGLFDTWTYEKPSFQLTEYGFPDDVFGILTIPKMNLEMPLYLGATWEHMAEGSAQLSQTSIPIGGKNTNAVIAGHRGWYGAPYFREILRLTLGDTVLIRNPWQTLTYQVTSIKIIQPSDVEAIHIQEGRDMITLLTCHPYASGGQQRYLVMCDRADESEEACYEQAENSRANCTPNSGA